MEPSSPGEDVNGVITGYLRDLASVQSTQSQILEYKHAATAIVWLETPVSELLEPDGELPLISGVGPSSARVIYEILSTGASQTVERAIDRSGRRADVERRRALRQHFLSRAAVLRILRDTTLDGPRQDDYRGDLQMHSEWSDGTSNIADLSAACRARGYTYAAVTDPSHGLTVACGISVKDTADQRRAIDRLNRSMRNEFLLLQGIETDIGAHGELDLSAAEAAMFDLVLAAPHSRLRTEDDQTDRLLGAIDHPRVRILAHPRGRVAGSRAGLVADWDTVFAAAARRGVAIEIDGDVERQDLDHTLARRALAAGCLFALDSNARATWQLVYADTALAHARLAGIPAERIVNCWPSNRLLAWLSDPVRELRSAA